LLDIAIRFADHIDSVFGPGKKEGTCGHPEVEMALVELYRETKDFKYLKLAKFFIDERGKGLVGGDLYHIDHKPFRELDEIVGHAVRSLYLNCGATDLFIETGELSLLNALERLWHNFVERKMYVTGGAGARYEGEAFGEEYALPNETAYAETCAAIASFMWNYRMLHVSCEGRFGDIMELVLYNGLLSGISLDGKTYFYVNPLGDKGRHRRQKWFACACCPPNIARLIASLPGYIYSKSFDGIWVHLYTSNIARIDWDGKEIEFEVKTQYPWDGLVEFHVNTEGEYSIFLRIPDWCKRYYLSINNEEISANIINGYAKIERTWKKGDILKLNLSMEPEFIVSNPKIINNIGRVAIKRGPIVYCLEQVDNSFNICDLEVFTNFPLNFSFEPLLGGVVVVRGKGGVIESNTWRKNLYNSLKEINSKRREVEFIAIPYFAWANREPGPMQIWIRKV
ncbi:MAG: glycoside hydrolase family 127 protein, partial [Dictyoglomaceae bacterium]|nr:glycoside hydrolase family 127 protein [Dictyoglomaceae bacterium]